MKNINAFECTKIGNRLPEILDIFVEEKSEINIVQLITNNGSSYVLAGRNVNFKEDTHVLDSMCLC